MLMKIFLNEGNKIHNFISSSGSGTVIIFRFRFQLFNKLRFRFHNAAFLFQVIKTISSCNSANHTPPPPPPPTGLPLQDVSVPSCLHLYLNF